MTITTPLGTVLRDDQGVRLEFVRSFPTDMVDLWSALTDSARCARWFGSWTGDPATDTVQLTMTAEDDDTAQPVTIIECEAPSRLVIELPAPDGSWRLAMGLRAIEGGTCLVFSQGLAEPDEATSIGPGWHFYLDRLAAVVGDMPVPDDWGAYEALASQYQAPS